MVLRKNAARINFEPKKLGSALWTERLTLYIYAEIEQAFTSASLLPVANAPCYLFELQACLKWVEQKVADPEMTAPKLCAIRTNQLFQGVILEERRKERGPVLQRIEQGGAGLAANLIQLRDWLIVDIALERRRKRGLPLPKGQFRQNILLSS